MFCNSCKNNCLDKCTEFNSFKTDNQLRAENFGCFEQRIYKVNRSLKMFETDENIYLDEMTDGEIQEAIRYGNVVKKIRENSVN